MVRNVILPSQLPERIWRKTLSDEDRQVFISQNDIVNNLIKVKKTAYFKDTLDNSNAKTMYKTINSLLNTSVQKLPASESNVELSNRFASFFTDKVCNLRTELDQLCNTDDDQQNVIVSNVQKSKCNNLNNNIQPLASFSNVSEKEVEEIISNLPNKSSPLDPLPTWLLKRCSEIVVPIIQSIINNST